jgi:hypothetical protein
MTNEDKNRNWLNIILIGVFIVLIILKIFIHDFYFFDHLTEFFVGGVVLLIYLQKGFQNTNLKLDGDNNNVYVVENYDALSEDTIKKILQNEEGKYIETLDYIEKIKARLKSYIKSLQTSSQLNLAIGLVTAIGGIVFLFQFINNHTQPEDNAKLVIYNISRLSLVLLTELFAFFFLRLYKTTLNELKYFQNELTNIDTKAIAIRIATMNKDNVIAQEIIKELVKGERNFIIQQGQSTITLEQNKLDSQTQKGFVDNLSELIKAMKGN